MKVKQRKCKVLHLGRKNPMHQCLLGATQLERSFVRKGPMGLGGYQVEHQSGMCSCCKED